MTITREEIAAFADGELSGEREAEIAAAMKADIRLAEQVDRHRALKTMLASHYAPIVDQPVPGRLAGLLAEPPRPEVVELAAAREKREARRLPRWGWIAGPALAASLAFALLLPNASDNPTAYADAQLAAVLEDRLVATQSPAEPFVPCSFFQKGAAVLRKSIMKFAPSKAAWRCGAVATTSTIFSPGAILP